MRELDKPHLYSVYFAPRGKERLLRLGDQLAHRHLNYGDKLIGIVGDAGSGKSLMIRGMFPGLVLTNDDDSVNSGSLMQVRDSFLEDYGATNYHIDMRFQMAFTQMFEIVEFVKGALKNGRRVIIEHFDLLYPALKINADIIFGVGEEIIVTRPNIFGPLPKDIFDIVFYSLKNRKMAHTAEDLTTLILLKDYNLKFKIMNSDVRRGFVLNFKEKPDIEIIELENGVKKLINQSIPVSYADENHIKIGDALLKCTGPRIHVRNTSEVKNFKMIDKYFYDASEDLHCLVGVVNSENYNENDLNKLRKEEF